MLDLGKGLEVLVHCSRNGEMFAAVRTKNGRAVQKDATPFRFADFIFILTFILLGGGHVDEISGFLSFFRRMRVFFFLLVVVVDLASATVRRKDFMGNILRVAC